MWWWPLPPALAMAYYAVSPNPPFPLAGEDMTRLLFATAAFLLVVSLVRQRLWTRIAAMTASMAACLWRASAIFFGSELDFRHAFSGVLVWVLLAGAFLVITVLTEVGPWSSSPDF